MKETAPRIGFDQFVRLDWAVTALKVRAGMATLDDVQASLDAAVLGVVNTKKTRTVLNRLWLTPRDELADFAERGVNLYIRQPETLSDRYMTALCWGMAVAAYPFFGKIAEVVGRLSALHGDCSTAEVQRRVSEIYGERTATQRATSRVIQSQMDWRVIERREKRITRLPPMRIDDPALTAWLMEAAVRHYARPLSLDNLHALPLLFPFHFTQSLPYTASKSPNLELWTEGSNHAFVTLREVGCG